MRAKTILLCIIAAVLLLFCTQSKQEGKNQSSKAGSCCIPTIDPVLVYDYFSVFHNGKWADLSLFADEEYTPDHFVMSPDFIDYETLQISGDFYTYSNEQRVFTGVARDNNYTKHYSRHAYDNLISQPFPDFISYEMLQVFGDFVSFYYHPGGNTNNYSYEFGDPRTEKAVIVLEIYANPTNTYYSFDSNLSQLQPPNDPNDLMFHHKVDFRPDAPAFWSGACWLSHGAYTLGNIKYRYTNGILDTVCWDGGSHTFVLSFSSDYDYSNPFINRFLHTDTAMDAVKAFNAGIQKALEERNTEK